MTTHYLWLITDRRPARDRKPPEIVAVTINEDPVQVAGVPIAYADREYIGEWHGQLIVPRTSADNRLTTAIFEQSEPYLDWLGGEGEDWNEDWANGQRIFEEQEREMRRKRGA